MVDRRASGRMSRARGMALEERLDEYHGELLLKGLANIRRVSTPVKVLGPVKADRRGRWVFRGAFDGPQGVDFMGYRMRNPGGLRTMAVPMAIEAKTHGGPGSWDSGIEPDGTCLGNGALGLAQWRELCDYQRDAGARAALVILEAWGEVWEICPVDLVSHVGRVRRRTVRPDEIKHIARRLSGVRWLELGADDGPVAGADE